MVADYDSYWLQKAVITIDKLLLMESEGFEPPRV